MEGKRDVPEKCEDNVDEEIGTASCEHQYCEGRDCVSSESVSFLANVKDS